MKTDGCGGREEVSNSSKAGEGMLVGRVRQARNWWGERARGVTKGGGATLVPPERERGGS